VESWRSHDLVPAMPLDEDPTLYARRLVAQTCLYGVDKNPFATDLAKLSLWLATLAKGHPFTFLDHALRCGDSLVGLDRERIACCDWRLTQQMPLIRDEIARALGEALDLRNRIRALAGSDDTWEKNRLLCDAERALDKVR